MADNDLPETVWLTWTQYQGSPARSSLGRSEVPSELTTYRDDADPAHVYRAEVTDMGNVAAVNWRAIPWSLIGEDVGADA